VVWEKREKEYSGIMMAVSSSLLSLWSTEFMARCVENDVRLKAPEELAILVIARQTPNREA